MVGIQRIFDTKLWIVGYSILIIILSIEIAIGGWDAGLYVPEVRFGYHYRTAILYVLIGLFAVIKFKNLTSPALTCFLSIALAFGSLGISEQVLLIPQFLTLNISLAQIIKNGFYYVYYIFQLLIVYIFHNYNPKLIQGKWNSRMKIPIIILTISSSILMIVAIYWVNRVYDYSIAFIPNYISKLMISLAFMLYIYGWSKE